MFYPSSFFVFYTRGRRSNYFALLLCFLLFTYFIFCFLLPLALDVPVGDAHGGEEERVLADEGGVDGAVQELGVLQHVQEERLCIGSNGFVADRRAEEEREQNTKNKTGAGAQASERASERERRKS